MNRTATMLLRSITEASLFPSLIGYWAHRLAVDRVTAFQWATERAATWPGPLGILRRRALYGRLLPRVGVKFTLSFGSLLSRDTAEFGDRVYVGWYSTLGDVRVGNDVLIADYVSIPSGGRQHGTGRIDTPMREQPGEYRTIRIGDDCWIGTGAVVLSDVASHCIVAAGSVVTRPTSAYEIVAGVPARAIGSRLDGKQPPPS